MTVWKSAERMRGCHIWNERERERKKETELINSERQREREGQNYVKERGMKQWKRQKIREKKKFELKLKGG